MAAECRHTLQTIRQGMAQTENQHELLVIAEDELPAYWLDLKVKQGAFTRDEANSIWEYWYQRLQLDDEQYEKVTKLLERTLGNTGTALSAVNSARLLRDFGLAGRFQETTYAGRRYIVFKGYPGLRILFLGTRYLHNNPQVVAMGIGRLGVREAALAGARLTVVLMGAYRILEYLFNDERTLAQLIGSLATDVVKIGVASAFGYGVAAVLVSFGFVSGPLIATVVFGAAAAFALEDFDGRIGGTEALVAQLEIVLSELQAADTWGCRLQASIRARVYDAADAVAQVVVDRARRYGEQAVRQLFEPRYYRGRAYLPRL